MVLVEWSKLAAGSLFVAALASPALAVNFDIVDERKFGSWYGGLYKNPTGSRMFCAVTGADGDSVIRMVRYNEGHTFLEVLNPDWKFLPGKGTVTFTFAIPDGPIKAEMHASRDRNSYSFDFEDEEKYLLFAGLMRSSTQVTVQNPNGKALLVVKGPGADKAFDAYVACTNGKMGE